MENIFYVNQMRYLKLDCDKILGNENKYTSDDLQSGDYFEAMKTILYKMDMEQKIDTKRALNFIIDYNHLLNKGISWLMKNEIDIVAISKEFEDIVGIIRIRDEERG